MSWTAHARERSLATRKKNHAEWLESMKLVGTREERAIALALKHIAEGSREPRTLREIWPHERYGRIPKTNPVSRARHGVSYMLYVAAFRVCMRARELGIRPKHENLDLVDSPARMPRKRARNRNGDLPND